jgi:hypothetical protein
VEVGAAHLDQPLQQVRERERFLRLFLSRHKDSLCLWFGRKVAVAGHLVVSAGG